MNALLMPEAVVKRAAHLYRDAGVTPFAGGILFEYAWRRNQIEQLIGLLARLDVPGLEISENYVTLTDSERHRLIERFQKAGISVVYEFGRKNPAQPVSIDYLGEIVGAVAQHGIHHVTVEQCEMDLLVQDSPDALVALAAQPWFERVVIEARFRPGSESRQYHARPGPAAGRFPPRYRPCRELFAALRRRFASCRQHHVMYRRSGGPNF
jgi:phosphosulfolactate synthase